MRPAAPTTSTPRTDGRHGTWRLGNFVALALLLAGLALTIVEWRGGQPLTASPMVLAALIAGLWLGGTGVFIHGLQRRIRQTAQRDRSLRVLTDSLTDYAIYMTDGKGRILSWDAGAQQITGYAAREIIGENFSRLFSAEDIKEGKPQSHLGAAGDSGRMELEDWRVRKDGSRFWAGFTITALRNERGAVYGFCHVCDDRTAKKQIELLANDTRHVLEMIGQNKPPAEVAAELIRMVQRQYPDAAVAVLAFNEGKLEPVGAQNLPGGFVEGMGACADDLLATLETWRRLLGDTPAANDLTAAGGRGPLRDLELQQGFRAVVRMPICSGDGRILGAVANYYRQPHGNAGDEAGQPKTAAGPRTWSLRSMCGTGEEAELLKTVARLAAVALEHRQLTEQLAQQTLHDPLTKLPNRAMLEDRMRLALAQSARNGKLVGLIFVDLDRFKEINDTLGHDAGDQLLLQVTRRFAEHVRQTDTLARMGGDEFTLLLPDLHDRSDAVRIARKLLSTLEAPMEIDGHELFLTASMGVAVHPEDGRDGGDLQKNADATMYRAKRAGRNRVECFDREMSAAAMEKLALEGQLRRGLERGEFEVHYQPELDRGGHIFAFEALVRWRHPTLGLLPPGKFIPLAEESGFIVALGRWVLGEACRQNKAWQNAGFAPVRVAVNVSALQFPQADFIQMLNTTLADSGLEPRWLELEMTESVLMHDAGHDIEKLSRIRALGARLAVDDFGTGYSSLAYLQKLPIDTLKIDRSFVRGITASDSEAPLVRAIVSLAHGLGMRVLAEGIETTAQRDALFAMGCDGLQGYLISTPKPAKEVEAFLRPVSSAAA